jgi:hypothetical protein
MQHAKTCDMLCHCPAAATAAKAGSGKRHWYQPRLQVWGNIGVVALHRFQALHIKLMAIMMLML